MLSLRIALTALWWRKGLSAAVLLVAAITTLAAALGPFFARAAGDSILRDTLRHAPVANRGVELTQSVLGGADVSSVTAVLPARGRLPDFADRIVGLSISGKVRKQGGGPEVATTLASREQVCAHLVIDSGRCAIADGEAVVSSRTSASYGWHVGDRLTVCELVPSEFCDGVTGTGEPSTTPRLRIVGIYRPADSHAPYWFGRDYFTAHLAYGSDEIDTIDAVFVPVGTLGMFGSAVNAFATVDLPLAVDAVHVRDTARLHAELALLHATPGSVVSTGLGALLHQVQINRRLLDIGVLAVTLQLALLAWFVLFLVIAATTEARANEVALAKLHGLPPSATVGFGLLEPALILLIATPVGLVLAYVATHLIAAAMLAPGTIVELRLLPVLAALAALVGGVVAAALGGSAALRRPVLEQWQRTRSDSAARRASTFVDGLVVALALAGVTQLVLSGSRGSQHADSMALIAPALLTLALAVLGARLLPLGCRHAVSATRRTGRVARFLAVRQVVRRPAVLRLVTLVALATGLAVFAVDMSAIAAANRADRAAYDVGAARVLDVSAPSADALLTTVHRLDPAGTAAMPVLLSTAFLSDPTGTGTLVAVDSTRMAAVLNWTLALSPTPLTRIARALHPPVPAPVRLSSGRIGMILTTTRLRAGAPPLTVIADVRSGDRAAAVPMGMVRSGTHRYTGTVRCAGRCELAGFEFEPALGQFGRVGAEVTLRGVSQGRGAGWAALDTRLTQPGLWQPRPAAGGVERGSLRVSGTGLTYRFTASDGNVGAVSIADRPTRLPAVFAGAASVRPAPRRIRNVDDATVPAEPVGRVAGFPGVTGGATVVDYDYAVRAAQQPVTAGYQVWLSDAAPPGFVARLQRAGIDVTGSVSVDARLAELDRSGPALALLLFVVVAGAAAVLAAGATAVSIYLSGRRRAFELAAMLAVGVRRRQLVRAALVEQVVVLGAGLLIGLVGGAAGVVLAVPLVPQFADEQRLPVPDDTLRLLPLLALVVLGAAIIAVTATAAATLLVRSASPARLREVAP